MILLGWAGCKDKHLSKYSSIYNEQVTLPENFAWMWLGHINNFRSGKALKVRPVMDVRYQRYCHRGGPNVGQSMVINHVF